MNTALTEITNRYAKEIGDFAKLLDSISLDTPSDRLFATHFILQILHRAHNAKMELENLPEKKE